jgi:hypothetical protein
MILEPGKIQTICGKIIFLHKLRERLLSSAVEQLTRNEQVVGSNPMGGSYLWFLRE